MNDLFKKLRVKVLSDDYLDRHELSKLVDVERQYQSSLRTNCSSLVPTQFAAQESRGRQNRIIFLKKELGVV